MLTPGGHRRYSRAAIQRLVPEEMTPRDAEQQLAQDMARSYDQSWSIRQVAERFECSYGVMGRLLSRQIGLRTRSGTYPAVDEDRER